METGHVHRISVVVRAVVVPLREGAVIGAIVIVVAPGVVVAPGKEEIVGVKVWRGAAPVLARVSQAQDGQEEWIRHQK
jgi:hypothetical protein